MEETYGEMIKRHEKEIEEYKKKCEHSRVYTIVLFNVPQYFLCANCNKEFELNSRMKACKKERERWKKEKETEEKQAYARLKRKYGK